MISRLLEATTAKRIKIDL